MSFRGRAFPAPVFLPGGRKDETSSHRKFESRRDFLAAKSQEPICRCPACLPSCRSCSPPPLSPRVQQVVTPTIPISGRATKEPATKSPKPPSAQSRSFKRPAGNWAKPPTTPPTKRAPPRKAFRKAGTIASTLLLISTPLPRLSYWTYPASIVQPRAESSPADRIATNTTCLTRTSFPDLHTKEFATRSPRSKKCPQRMSKGSPSMGEPGYRQTRHGRGPEVGPQ